MVLSWQQWVLCESDALGTRWFLVAAMGALRIGCSRNACLYVGSDRCSSNGMLAEPDGFKLVAMEATQVRGMLFESDALQPGYRMSRVLSTWLTTLLLHRSVVNEQIIKALEV